MTAYRALERLSRSQLSRGIGLALLGSVAINWPERALPVAMTAAGVGLVLSGGYDLGIAFAARHVLRVWVVLGIHGLASLTFGLLTIGLPYVEQRAALPMVAAWMALYGLMMTTLAFALWPMRRTRWALLGSTLLVISTGVVATRMHDLPTFVPLYLGAFFAVLLGAMHVSAGLWLRRIGMPAFAPTLQSTWAPPAMHAGERPRSSV
jgi:Uncharacterized conserved protein